MRGLGVRALSLAAICLFALQTVPAESVPHDGDEPGDAGDRWQDARDIFVTAFSGQFGATDPADWYRFSPPAGFSLHIELDPLANFSGGLWAVNERGENLSVSRYIYWQNNLTVRVPPDVGPVRFGLFPDEPGPYTVKITPYEPAPQNDADLGDDAPGIRDEAFEIRTLTIEGELIPTQRDSEDWYRLIVPSGLAVRASLVASEPSTYITLAGDRGWAIWHAEERMQVGVPADGVLRVGVRGPWSESNGSTYRVELELGPLPDVRVVNVSVAPEAIPFEPIRSVSLILENRGGDADDVHVWGNAVQGIAPASTSEDFGHQIIPLLAGETRTIDMEWEALGRVGFVGMQGCAIGMAEADESDNEGWAEAWVGPTLPLTVGFDPVGMAPVSVAPGGGLLPISVAGQQSGGCVRELWPH